MTKDPVATARGSDTMCINSQSIAPNSLSGTTAIFACKSLA